MNKRIQELAEQARKRPMGNSWCYTNPAEFEQKFAELIVRECAFVCKSMQLIGPYKEVQDATLKDASVQIQEHFGVKE